MKRKILPFLIFLGPVITAYPQTLTCSCGSQSSGTTIEYQIINPGTSTINCCTSRPVGSNNAYNFSWAPSGRGNYVMTGVTIYPTSAAAQADCCQPDS